MRVLETQHGKLLFIFLLAYVLVLPYGSYAVGESEFPAPLTVDDLVSFDMTAYHSYDETVTELNRISKDHPNITKLISIGKTYEGRDIWAMKVSDNPDIEEDEPEVYFDGCHHAREWMTIEVCLYMLNCLTDNYTTNATITGIVDTRQIWVVPCVNPDGRVYDSPGDDPSNHSVQPFGWRKNRVDNGDGTFGVDPNRNYDYMWGSVGSSRVTNHYIYRGPEPFSENETKAVRDFVRQHDFVFAITYHSYSQLMLYPWAYTHNKSQDNELFKAVGNQMARLTTNNAKSGYPGYVPQQSCDLYLHSGTSVDWLYGEMGIYAYCVELYPAWDDYDVLRDPAVSNPYDVFHPRADKVVPVCEDNIGSALYLMQISDNPFQALNHHVSLSASMDLQVINRTETKSFEILVTNDGASDNTFELSTSKIPGWNINLSSTKLFLNGETSGRVNLTVTAPAKGISGDYQVMVNASTIDPSQASDFMVFTVKVPCYYDVGVLSIDSFIDGETYPAGHYSITSTVANLGHEEQSEFNASLEIRALGTPVMKPIFFDNMNFGDNNWKVTDLDGQISPDSWKRIRVAENDMCWWCGTNTQYSSNTAQLLISPSFDLREATNASLTFYHKFTTQTLHDFCNVDVYNGSVWTTVACFDGQGPGVFTQIRIDLEDFVGSEDVRIRFRFASDEEEEYSGWFIDDVNLLAEFPTETTIFGPELTQTIGVMQGGESQQVNWDYTFMEAGYYKVYVTTHTKKDEFQSNNQSAVKIRTTVETFNASVLAGWNFISFPLDIYGHPLDILNDSTGGGGFTDWDIVMSYDNLNKIWLTYSKNRPNSLNTLTHLDCTMGFWINITNPGDGNLTFIGPRPGYTSISLYSGWNLVGYPSLNDTETVGVALWGTSADSVEICDINEPYHIKEVGPTYVMKPSEGYWVHVPADTVWTIDW